MASLPLKPDPACQAITRFYNWEMKTQGRGSMPQRRGGSVRQGLGARCTGGVPSTPQGYTETPFSAHEVYTVTHFNGHTARAAGSHPSQSGVTQNTTITHLNAIPGAIILGPAQPPGPNSATSHLGSPLVWGVAAGRPHCAVPHGHTARLGSSSRLPQGRPQELPQGAWCQHPGCGQRHRSPLCYVSWCPMLKTRRSSWRG